MVKCIISARKGSSRIKGKNLLKIKGDTLIDITVNSALKSNVCDQVLLSTDLNIKYDRKNVILDKRPKSTAEGKVSSATLLKYIFKKYNCKENEIIILLQPTSPSRKPEDIKKAFSLFKRKRMPVVSVFEAKKLQDNLCALERKNLMKKIQIKKEKIYQINGAIYIFSVRQFKKEKTIPQNEFVPYIMDEKDSVDIDKYSDYIKAVLLH
ncbi:MAG: hypothetical protein COX48_03510 [bacterium (Candidatus Stahlbacteria) CG23_combo_of_CG06-09_8_20_14_all_34_7]|nr:MAG: hypothetical protein COX48_03510 [bacterium (Candidatus Stahlbacteria) CG23_combo_of_CG06-09_8_20_14_all_34_7]